MVIEPHMKQGRQHKLISTIFLATSVTKKLDHNKLNKIYAPAVLTKKYLEESVFAQAEAHISFIRIVKWSLYLNRE